MAHKPAALIGEPFHLSDHIVYAEGSVISKTLIDKGIGNITLFSFDKGQGLSEHTSPFDAVVYIIDGAAKITISEKVVQVKTGEMIIMPANIPHSLTAEERFKMVLTMIRKKVEKRENRKEKIEKS